MNYYFHDSTACLVKNGVLIAAIQEERLNRDKHTRSFPMLAINRCLKMAGLSYADIDHIALSIKPTHNLGKKNVHSLKHLKTIKPFINLELVHGYNKQKVFEIGMGNIVSVKSKVLRYILLNINLSHALGSFFYFSFL